MRFVGREKCERGKHEPSRFPREWGSRISSNSKRPDWATMRLTAYSAL